MIKRKRVWAVLREHGNQSFLEQSDNLQIEEDDSQIEEEVVAATIAVVNNPNLELKYVSLYIFFRYCLTDFCNLF